MKIKKNIFVFLISIACYFAIAILRGQHYERIMVTSVLLSQVL